MACAASMVSLHLRFPLPSHRQPSHASPISPPPPSFRSRGRSKTLRDGRRFVWTAHGQQCAAAFHCHAFHGPSDPIPPDVPQPSLPLSGTFLLLAPFIRSQWRLILKAWLCTLVSVGAVYLFIPETGNLSKLLALGDMESFLRKCSFVVVLLAVRSVSHFWQQVLLWEAALMITFDVRQYAFAKIMARGMGFFEGKGGVPSGDIAYRVTAEAEVTGETIHALLQTLIPSMLQLVAMLVRMLMLCPLLSIATIWVVPCISLAIANFGERLRKLSRRGQDSIASLASYLNEVLPSMLIVKSHAAEDFEQWRFKRLSMTDCEARLQKKRMKAFIPEAVTAVYIFTAVILFAVATWAVSQKMFSGASMVSFVTALALLVEPIQALGKSYNEMKLGEPAIERLFELANFTPDVIKGGTRSLASVCGDVKFCNVSFRYIDSRHNVLTNVTIHAHAGETVALVGPSGGGKTTLAKLLLRLYDPNEGCILIDGHDIRDFSLKCLRTYVGVVPQEVVLFTGTVAENIAYGDRPHEIDMNKVLQAAILANADNFIRNLPYGYRTNLGDRCSSLSGGQRQRLAIARAIYQEPSILVLDEATSALDNTSEKLVREALARLMVGCTVFVIAHRLETVQKADRIFFIDGGRLVEEGTHASLLAMGGSYALMYNRQEVTKPKAEAFTPPG